MAITRQPLAREHVVLTVALFLFLLLLTGCGQRATPKTSLTQVGTMKLTSPAFEHNAPIPALYTCDERNINPPLQISDVPSNAKSLALIVDDPDAPSGDFVHWTVWNIPPSMNALQAGATPSGVTEGMTDFGKSGYGGPCPPSGVHHYQFKLYALDTTLTLGPETTKRGLEQAMEGHVLAQALLTGTYRRR